MNRPFIFFISFYNREGYYTNDIRQARTFAKTHFIATAILEMAK